MNGSNLTTYGIAGATPDYSAISTLHIAVASDDYEPNRELREPVYEPEWEDPPDIPKVDPE